MRITCAMIFIFGISILVVPLVTSTDISGNYDKSGRAPTWASALRGELAFTISDDDRYAAISNSDGNLSCLDPRTGTLNWFYVDDQRASIDSVISGDGSHILACTRNEIMLFSTSSKEPLWSSEIQDEIQWGFYISISDDGSLSLLVYNNKALLYSNEGELIRSYHLGDYVYSRGKISGNGEYMVCTDGCNYQGEKTKVYLFSTNSTQAVWTKEVNGTGVEVDISRTGDVVLVIQDIHGFKEGDPLGIGKYIVGGIEGAVIGTVTHSGGPALYSNNGSLIWAYDAGGVESFDMDPDGNWFCISGYYGECALLDRDGKQTSILKDEGWIAEYVSVSSTGRWMYVYRESLFVHDMMGEEIFERTIRDYYTSLITTGTHLSNDGVLFYALIGGRLMAFEEGPYPEFLISSSGDFKEGGEVIFDLESSSDEPSIEIVEWFVDDDREPVAVLGPNENFSYTFENSGWSTVYALAHSDEGSPGVAEERVQISDEDETLDSGPSPYYTIFLSVTVISLVLIFKRKEKMDLEGK